MSLKVPKSIRAGDDGTMLLSTGEDVGPLRTVDLLGLLGYDLSFGAGRARRDDDPVRRRHDG